MEFTMNKGSIVFDLLKNTREILYKKKDGTERVVKATLQESIVPKTKANEFSYKPVDTHVTVFDVEKQEWRSLIIGNIIKIVE